MISINTHNMPLQMIYVRKQNDWMSKYFSNYVSNEFPRNIWVVQFWGYVNAKPYILGHVIGVFIHTKVVGFYIRKYISLILIHPYDSDSNSIQL